MTNFTKIKTNKMKSNKLFPFFYIFLFLTLFSCKEDIELVGEFKETALVYGVLDQADSVHFIKINRAFIGPGNALEFAKIPDSSYFENLSATITEKLNGNVVRSWTLNDTLLDNKSENGIFYAPTQKVYYFENGSLGGLNTDAIYHLEIVINEGAAKEFKVTGETNLVNGLASSLSNTNSSFQFLDNQKVLKTFPVIASSIGNSSIINISLKLNFDEYKTNNDTNNVVIDWNLGESEVTSSYSAIIQGQRFYELIKENITQDNLINKRQFQSIEIIITGGSSDLNTYINSNKPSSTLTQSKPNFTNLSTNSKNTVVGIFTSRQTLTIKKVLYAPNAPTASCLDQKSRDYLCTGDFTGTLLFCSQHNMDANKNYYCQ